MYLKLTILVVFVQVFCLTLGAVMRREQQNYDTEDWIDNQLQATNCSGFRDSCETHEDCCTEQSLFCFSTELPGKKACYGGPGPPDKVPCHSKSGCGRSNKKCNNTSDCCCGYVCVGGGDLQVCEVGNRYKYKYNYKYGSVAI